MKSEGTIRENLSLILVIIATTCYTVFAVIERTMNKSMHDLWHRSMLAFCAAAWLGTDIWWLSLILLLFIVLDFLALRKLVVKVSETDISMPALFVKKVGWFELTNVILKDDLLTIDFKNNKLFQQLILNSDWDVNEKEFNEFCKLQLNK